MSKFWTKFIIDCLIILGVVYGIQAIKKLYPDKGFNDKRTAIQQHTAEINAVFMGASSVQHHIDPILFDSLLNDQEIPISSYNFGVNAMFTLERLLVLKSFLEIDLPKLKYVFWEIRDISIPDSSILHGRTANRVVASSNLKNTLIRLKLIRARDADYETVMDQTSTTLKAHLKHHNLSIYAKSLYDHQLVETFLGEKQSEKLPEWMSRRKGFMSMNDILPGRILPIRKQFLSVEGRKEYRDFVADLKRHSENPALIQQEHRLVAEVIREAVDIFEENGIKVILFASPGTRVRTLPVVALLKQQNLPVIDLSDPIKHPALFAVENHYDHDHLNRRGAALQTREMARQAIEILRDE